ncbi:MAG: hypothetical protein SPJ57_03130 [Candidatus Methanomethylophilaceae archaeon]|nr:hypothetical protein [Candidatus Methanomethylophilaceae archaeon]
MSSEVYPIQIQQIYACRIPHSVANTDHNEHWIPGLVHRLLVVPELVVVAPGNHAPVLDACPELDPPPELPSCGDFSETEIGIYHRMNESAVGVIISWCAMNKLELLWIEHGDDIILEVVTKTVEEFALLLFAPLLLKTSFSLDPLAFFLLLTAVVPSLK